MDVFSEIDKAKPGRQAPEGTAEPELRQMSAAELNSLRIDLEVHQALLEKMLQQCSTLSATLELHAEAGPDDSDSDDAMQELNDVKLENQMRTSAARTKMLLLNFEINQLGRRS